MNLAPAFCQTKIIRTISRFIPYRHFVPLPPKEEAKRLFLLKLKFKLLLLKLKFNLYAKTNLASTFGGSVGNADDRGLYVILSVSEISHRTIALIVVIARHEVPRQSVGVKCGAYTP